MKIAKEQVESHRRVEHLIVNFYEIAFLECG